MTVVATVAVLIGQAAERASAFDEAIGQEGLRDRVVKLLDILFLHQTRGTNLGPDLLAELAGFRAVGAAVVVELDIEAGEIAHVRLLHIGDQFFFGAAFLAGTDHDRGAVSIVGTDVNAAVAAQLLEPHPDIGLDILHQVPDMDVPVGIRQRGRNEDLARGCFRLRHCFSVQIAWPDRAR